ncbi:MAG: dihydroorotate dehydrogenase electron transfer subunit [Thermoplasmata archaeon]
MRNERIVDVRRVGEEVFTIRFTSDLVARPGQFLMVWVPGGKEVPMSLSSVSNPFSITFKVFGETTRSLASLKKGDRIYFRGPYGNSYPEPKGRVAYVAGGTGLASLMSMMDRFEGDTFVGARTKADLFLIRDDFHVATDDGSQGTRGSVVDLFYKHAGDYDYVYVCGPEQMEKALIDRLHNVRGKVYFSLERLMKCGIGICDSCSINGFRVCRDGPIVELNDLRKLDEFGRTRRSESGKLQFLSSPER